MFDAQGQPIATDKSKQIDVNLVRNPTTGYGMNVRTLDNGRTIITVRATAMGCAWLGWVGSARPRCPRERSALQVISPAGAAARSGALAVNDTIVAIDGQFIIGHTHESIVRRLKESNKIRLTVVKVGKLRARPKDAERPMVTLRFRFLLAPATL